MSRFATRFNKRDANEQIIIHALAMAGVEWVEAGPLDGWIFLGQWMPVEIKVPGEKLTDGQKAFMARCEIDRMPYRLWRNANEAVEAVQVYRESMGGRRT